MTHPRRIMPLPLGGEHGLPYSRGLMARALMARPSLLLLDEPSMGLSPILVDTIFQIIQDINRQGTTILLVEQNARMALRVAHRGYVMQTGRIVLHDAAGELLRSDLVRKTYLGEK